MADKPIDKACCLGREVKRCIRGLKREGFRFVHVINSPEQLENVEIVRTRLWNDRRDEHGPFDIIGDIHGCFDELLNLLTKLGYQKTDGTLIHPDGRKAAFLGDFCGAFYCALTKVLPGGLTRWQRHGHFVPLLVQLSVSLPRASGSWHQSL